jgi:hypothetical protein
VVAHSLQLTTPAREDIATTCKERTRTGKPCRNKPMRGRDVCKQHSKDPDVGRPGRPSKFTPERRERLLLSLRAGSYFHIACAYAGISESLGYEWLKQGKADLDAGEETEFAKFLEAYTRACAEIEMRLQQIWLAGMQDHPGEAGEFLAARFPDRWGRRDIVQRVEAEIDVTHLFGGKQPVEVPAEVREKILALLAEAEGEPVDATVVEE